MSTEHARAGLLQRVANTLGVPIDSLFTDATPNELGGTIECLRLWHRLTSDAQRRRALDALRVIADEPASLDLT